MVVGEERSWLKHWSSVRTTLDLMEEEKIINSARTLRDQWKLDEAIIELNNFLLKQDNVKTLTLLGEIYILKKDFISAEHTLQEALSKNQDSECHSWIYRCLGKLNHELIISGTYNHNPIEKQRRFTLALTYLYQAIESAQDRQDKIWAIYEKAYLYYTERDYRLAKENIELLLDYDPGNKSFRELSQKIIAGA
jgi:tetratricopeptide (TPR) repeat protein